MAIKNWEIKVDLDYAKVWLNNKGSNYIGANKHIDNWNLTVYKNNKKSIVKENLTKAQMMTYAENYMRRN